MAEPEIKLNTLDYLYVRPNTHLKFQCGGNEKKIILQYYKFLLYKVEYIFRNQNFILQNKSPKAKYSIRQMKWNLTRSLQQKKTHFFPTTENIPMPPWTDNLTPTSFKHFGRLLWQSQFSCYSSHVRRAYGNIPYKYY